MGKYIMICPLRGVCTIDYDAHNVAVVVWRHGAQNNDISIKAPNMVVKMCHSA